MAIAPDGGQLQKETFFKKEFFCRKSVTRHASAIDLSPPERLLMGRRPPTSPKALEEEEDELTRVRERRRCL